jgi:hypothetical protein
MTSSPPPTGNTIGRDTAEGSLNGARAEVTVSVRVVAGEVRGCADRAGVDREPGAGDGTADAAQPAKRTPEAATTNAELNSRIPGC